MPPLNSSYTKTNSEKSSSRGVWSKKYGTCMCNQECIEMGGEHVTPLEAHSLVWIILKIEHRVTSCSLCGVYVTIFNTGGKFWPVSNFTEFTLLLKLPVLLNTLGVHYSIFTWQKLHCRTSIKGGTHVLHINVSDIGDVFMSFPPPPPQQKANNTVLFTWWWL